MNEQSTKYINTLLISQTSVVTYRYSLCHYLDKMLHTLSVIPLAELQGHRHTRVVGMHQMHNSTGPAAAESWLAAQLLQQQTFEYVITVVQHLKNLLQITGRKLDTAVALTGFAVLQSLFDVLHACNMRSQTSMQT